MSSCPQDLSTGGQNGDRATRLLIPDSQACRFSLADLSSKGAVGAAATAWPKIDAAAARAAIAGLAPAKSEPTATPPPSRRRKPNFAEKLHAVLGNVACRHAISWMPSGRSFCIADQGEFVRDVLPKYFREAKFESFSRRLKRWGFRKVYTAGMGQVIFAHDLFHRDRPDLCKIMHGREKVGAKGGSPGGAVRADCTAGCAAGPSLSQGQLQFEESKMRQQLQLKMAAQNHMDRQRIALLASARLQGQGSSGSLRSSILQGQVSPCSLQSSIQPVARLPVDLQRASPTPGYVGVAPTVAPPMPAAARFGPSQQAQSTGLDDYIADCEARLAVLRRLDQLNASRQAAGPASIWGASPLHEAAILGAKEGETEVARRTNGLHHGVMSRSVGHFF